MQSNIYIKRPGLIAGIVLSALGISLLVGMTTELTHGSATQRPASSGFPMRLTIPAISVDAVIESVGITSDGAMGAPKGPSDVAWYELGPRPGENGSAVIAGHYGWTEGKAAVFDNLSALKKGDTIYVIDEKGATSTFIVRELRTYGANQEASEVFASTDGKAHLNLITCEGVWNETEKSYSKRLVVFADKE